ncbi:MAG: JAB domain-containing protein [Bacteroidetes bacterium]|nr:JAB domain-containing protein [Bacteroidota bacterium]
MLNNFKLQNQVAEIRVTYTSKIKATDRAQIHSSSDAELLLRGIWDSNMDFKESFYLLLTNRANRVLGWYKLSEGGLCATIVDMRILFSIAVKSLACGMILAHNHPSGNTRPSETDQQLTDKIKTAAKMMEITLLDHLILTSDSYLSFADEGLL